MRASTAMILPKLGGRRHANFNKFLRADSARGKQSTTVRLAALTMRFMFGFRRPIAGARFDASFRVLPAAAAREPKRGADRLAPADAARRHDPPVERRHLFLAAARVARPQKGGAHRTRRTGPRRRARDSDADDPA